MTFYTRLTKFRCIYFQETLYFVLFILCIMYDMVYITRLLLRTLLKEPSGPYGYTRYQESMVFLL